MRPTTSPLAALSVSLGLLMACQGEPTGGAGTPATPDVAATTSISGAAPHEGVTSALEAAGLTVGRFTPEPGSTCARGSVEGLEGLLCPNDPSAEPAARRFLDGAVNGAFRDARGYVLAVADRDNSDPRGVRINKVLKAFAADAPR